MYFGRVNFDLVKPFDIWKVVSGSGSFENEAEPEIFLWESVDRDCPRDYCGCLFFMARLPSHSGWV